jgi:hypothetical protein
MAPSNKKERGRKNRKNQATTSASAFSAGHSDNDITNARAVVDGRKNNDFDVDAFLMSVPNHMRSEFASKIERAMRYDDKVASLKKTDEHNETNDPTTPSSARGHNTNSNTTSRAVVDHRAYATKEVDVVLMSLPNTLRSQVTSRRKRCVVQFDNKKERGRRNRKDNALASASAITNAAAMDDFLMTLPKHTRGETRDMLQRAGAEVTAEVVRINETDDHNETNDTMAQKKNKKKERNENNEKTQASASVVVASDGSASASSGHNINNIIDANNGKFSSDDFASEMNQRLNNLDIIDAVASEQSGSATTKPPPSQASITANKPPPVVTGNNNSNNNNVVRVGHHANWKDVDGFPMSDVCQRVGKPTCRVNRCEINKGGKTAYVMGTWKQGAETGCIPSMINYAGNMSEPHLALPWFLEGAIRGHPLAVTMLVDNCYGGNGGPGPYSFCLSMYWSKMVEDWVGNDIEKYANLFEGAKEMKNRLNNICNVCGKQESDLVDLKTCNGCKMGVYCSKECQTIDWDNNHYHHKTECNQLSILMKYHSPYSNDIREAIMRGQDPKTILSLQKLRKKLGLTRPRKEYEEYLDLKSLDDDDDSDSSSSSSTNNNINTNPRTLLIPRNNGTVYVGSTTETI